MAAIKNIQGPIALLKSIVAAANIRIMEIVWVTYLGVLLHLNATLTPQISAHPPVLDQCKVHCPWALFCEGTVLAKCIASQITTCK